MWQCLCMFCSHTKPDNVSGIALPSCKFLRKLTRKRKFYFRTSQPIWNYFWWGLRYNHLVLLSQDQFIGSSLVLTKYYIRKEWRLVWNWIASVKTRIEGIQEFITLLQIHTHRWKGFFFFLTRQVNPKLVHNSNNIETHDERDCVPRIMLCSWGSPFYEVKGTFIRNYTPCPWQKVLMYPARSHFWIKESIRHRRLHTVKAEWQRQEPGLRRLLFLVWKSNGSSETIIRS